jgi:hypothetical protein
MIDGSEKEHLIREQQMGSPFLRHSTDSINALAITSFSSTTIA